MAIGHKGDSYFAPENTLTAFSACEGKADIVEFDVRLSLDGTLVVFHDDTVERTSDGIGQVGQMTLAELKALDVGAWFGEEFQGEQVPTLAEAIQVVAPFAECLIHAKTGSGADYVQVIQSLGASHRVILQSMDLGIIDEARRLDSELRLGVVGDGTLTTDELDDFRSDGIHLVTWSSIYIGSAEVQAAHDRGMQVYVWTVNDGAIHDYLDLGVDGIISDDPGMVTNLAGRAGNRDRRLLSRGIVSYWTFDELVCDLATQTVPDMEMLNPIFFESTGEASPCSVGPTEKFGKALRLDGQDSYVRVPPSVSLDIGTNQVTLALWLKLEQLPSELSQARGSVFDSMRESYVIYLDRGSKELRFRVTDVEGQSALPGIPEELLEVGGWHHVCAIYDGNAGRYAGQASIYLDGRLVDVHTGGRPPARWHSGLKGNVQAGQAAAIGRQGTDCGAWQAGEVDDIAIWRRALNCQEVFDIYARGCNGLTLDEQFAQLSITDLALTLEGDQWVLGGRVDRGRVQIEEVQVVSAETATSVPHLLPVVAKLWTGESRFEFLFANDGLAGGSGRFLRLVAPSLTLLSNDFDLPSLVGWKSVDEGIIEGPSSWFIQGGRLRQESNIYGPFYGAEENRKGTFLYWSDPEAFQWEDYSLSVTMRTEDNDGIGVMFCYRDPDNYYKLEMDRQFAWKRFTKTVRGAETTLGFEVGAYATNSPLALTVVVDGGEIRTTLNGALMFGHSIADQDLESGTIALYSYGSQGVMFDDVNVSSLTFAPSEKEPVVLLLSDFESGRMDAWTVIDEGMVEGPSQWELKQGRLRQDSNLYGPAFGTEENREGTFCFWNDLDALSWTNYRLSFVVNTVDDDGIGVLFRYRDPENYYKLEFDRQFGWKRLVKKRHGIETILSQESGGYEMNADLAVDVRVDGPSFTASLNGQLLFGGGVSDPDLGEGTIALYSFGSQGVAFDNVLIEALESDSD